MNGWHLAKDNTNVQSFLGLASYYRRFCKKLSNTMAPLTALLEQKIDSTSLIINCNSNFWS